MAKKKKASDAKKKTGRKKAGRKKTSVTGQPPLSVLREQLRAANRSPDVAYARAKMILDKWKGKILAIDDVIDVDIGMKVQNNRSTREFAICVHVSKKRPLPDLSKKNRIPDDFDGVPTDVQVHEFRPAVTTSAQPEGGIGIRPTGASFIGTLGIDVFSLKDSFVRYLTCTHVVSPTNQITAQTQMEEGGGVSIGFATPDADDWVFDDLLDCALITPPTPSFSRVGIPKGVHNPFGMRNPGPHDMIGEPIVWKLGVNGLTTNGRIDKIKSGRIQLTNGVWVKDQILIAPKTTQAFADESDSGSIVVIGDQAVGVIRAVNLTNGQALASPIVKAAARLQFIL